MSSPSRGRVTSLDGVRAVAIALVVLFHLGLPAFESGFIGVDMFFVLSGFLVTAMIVERQARGGRFGVSDFWSRRVRRLLPAMAVLLLVVAIVGPLVSTYSQTATLRADLLWSTAYLANWRFIQTSSYFEFTGFISPLQHLWALAVEVQFYLVWPLVLVALIALARGRIWLATAGCVVLAIASAALFLGRYDPLAVERAYMGTDTRLFQALIGALGALLIARRADRPLPRWVGVSMLILGCALLAGAVVMVDPGGPVYFRGGAFVVAAATLLIVVPLWQGRGGVVGRGLGWAPLAALGVISYSLFLWHWPIILWLRANDATAPALTARRVAAVVISVILATISYLVVERTFLRSRSGRHAGATSHRRAARWTVVIGAASLGLVACVAALTTRVPPPAPGQPVIVIAGDSVPERLAAAFDRAAEDRGWRVYSAAVGGCPTSGDRLIARFNHHTTEPDYCIENAVEEQDRLIDTYDPDVVVWWDRYSLGSFETPEGETVRSGTPLFWELKSQIVDATVTRLHRDGATVVFVATEPYGMESTDFDACPTCGTAWGRFVGSSYDTITTAWNRMLADYAAAHPADTMFTSVTDEICRRDEMGCDDAIDGVSARPDGIHYEGAGQRVVTDAILDAIAPLVTPAGQTG